MFDKIGSPQPLNVVSRCCVCDRPASVSKDGKLYCSECSPAIELNDEKPCQDMIA
jgi:hypothetical protein